MDLPTSKNELRSFQQPINNRYEAMLGKSGPVFTKWTSMVKHPLHAKFWPKNSLHLSRNIFEICWYVINGMVNTALNADCSVRRIYKKQL
jgi:hypothetical protein